MKTQENIYVSLRLKKDKPSGQISLNTSFDKNAPNFVTFKNVISWSPTNEEMNFLTEAFTMMEKDKKVTCKNNKNIFVDVHVERDAASGELMLNVYFDKNAPNFYNDGNDINWSPTAEELEFINEALDIFSKGIGIAINQDDHEEKEPEPVTEKDVEEDQIVKARQELITVSDIQMNSAACVQVEGDHMVDKLISKRKRE
jgi:hypothetical protein